MVLSRTMKISLDINQICGLVSRTSPQGSPLNLHMPAEIGDYEIRYVLHDGYKTIATRLISVVERDLSIDSVESVDSPAYAEMIG